MKGGQNGPVVVSSKPGKSELIRRVKGTSTPQMPLADPALTESAIRILEKWIAAGASAPNR
ncbi:MAG: hypothetical protein ACLFRF_08370 [Desulfobacterales bacterium]